MASSRLRFIPRTELRPPVLGSQLALQSGQPLILQRPLPAGVQALIQSGSPKLLYSTKPTGNQLGIQSGSPIIQLGGGGGVAVNKFYNSLEPGGDGSDPNCVFADDFHRGAWFDRLADDIPGGGAVPGNPSTVCAGWFGTGRSPIVPAKAIDSTTRMLGLTHCATYGDALGATGGQNYAFHELSAGNGSSVAALYDELWVRRYYLAGAGFRWGAHKDLNHTVFAGDIAYWNLQINCGNDTLLSTGNPDVQKLFPVGQDFCQGPNIVSLEFVPGVVYCVHTHTKLSTTSSSADGLIEIWITKCGSNGLSPQDDSGNPVTSPILRYRRPGLNFGRSHPSAQTNPSHIEVLWFEAWANPGSVGSSFLGGIYCSKASLPGFYGFYTH